MICGSLKDIALFNQAWEGFADLQPLKVEKKLDRWETWQPISEYDSEDEGASTQSVLNLKTFQKLQNCSDCW
jgi:hypothetical protein